MTLAHVAGVPVEEWLTPLVAMVGGVAGGVGFAVRAVWYRWWSRSQTPDARSVVAHDLAAFGLGDAGELTIE